MCCEVCCVVDGILDVLVDCMDVVDEGFVCCDVDVNGELVVEGCI